MKKQLVSWLHEAQAIGMLFALAKARLSSRRYMVPSSCICKKCRSNPKVNVHRKHTLNAALKRGLHQLCKQPHWRQASEAAEVPGRFGMSCSAPELSCHGRHLHPLQLRLSWTFEHPTGPSTKREEMARLGEVLTAKSTPLAVAASLTLFRCPLPGCLGRTSPCFLLFPPYPTSRLMRRAMSLPRRSGSDGAI